MNQAQDINTSEDQIQKEIDKLVSASKKHEQNIRYLETKAIQNVNLYFIYQAIILATSTTAAATCRHWWAPFVLSLLAATTNLLALIAVTSKVLQSRNELDQNLSDIAFMKLYPIMERQLSRVLPGSSLEFQGQEIIRPKACSKRRWKRLLAVSAFISLFVGFSTVVMYGCYRILCHPGDRKCVKLS